MLALLAEAAEWTAARGHPNWPARFSERLVARGVRDGELFVAEIDRSLVATVTLQWSDVFFWGDVGGDATAGYIHRLAVRRAHGGVGLGERLLDWVDDRIRARDRTRLRLDVVTSNGPLRHYYERAGFGLCRDVEGDATHPDGAPWHWRTSLYERPVRDG